jgi:molecular chaperone GrpE
MPDDSAEAPTSPPANAEEAPKSTRRETPGATEDWSTRYKYLLADFDNFRRRVDRDRESISRQSRAALVRELLPIIEAFQAARKSFAQLPASDPVRRGLDLLDHEWSKFLKHEGVEPVAVAGKPFRADEEEAVGEHPADGEHPEGSVVEVVQQGYRFFGGLLRPAKVIVARASTPREPEGEAEADSASQE